MTDRPKPGLYSASGYSQTLALSELYAHLTSAASYSTPYSTAASLSRKELRTMPDIYNMRGGNFPCWAVRIDRQTKWGNPFVIGRDGTRVEVIDKFEVWLKAQPELVEAVRRELRGKDLLCWCHPKPCHGDVLMRIANE